MIEHDQLSLPGDWRGIKEPASGMGDRTSAVPHAPMLHVAIASDTTYKIGTCEHCVLQERGRPERAWDAEGDRDLDFDRDRYLALLAALGVIPTDRQAYVCP